KVTPNEQFLILSLYNGIRYDELHDNTNPRETRAKRPFRQQKFLKQEVLFALDPTEFNRTNLELFRHNARMQNMTQLITTLDSIQENKQVMNNRAFQHFYTYNVFKSLNTREEKAKPISIDSL